MCPNGHPAAGKPFCTTCGARIARSSGKTVATLAQAKPATIDPLTVTLLDGDEETSWTLGPVGKHLVGRGEEVDCLVPDRRVSRVHGKIGYADGRWIYEDSSSAGTYLIDKDAFHEVPIRCSGESITIESSTRFRLGDPVDGPMLLLEPHRAALPVADFADMTREKAGNRLVATDAGFRLGGKVNKTLLSGIDLDLAPGSLTAVIGPSGAGKSTFIKVLIGQLQPTSGGVAYGGHDVNAEQQLVRQHIGYVPQDDIVHKELTVERALDYAARMRLDLPEDQITERVQEVVGQLDLGNHMNTSVGRLSGGQRKRVSVAIELLTQPQVLVLDEPTSGLDPALDEAVMVLLRKIADSGRIVVVVTHTPASLQLCDSVLVLAPGGKPAFLGPADAILKAYGAASWSTVFDKVATDPDAAHQKYLTNCTPSVGAAPQVAGPMPVREIPFARRQLSVLIRRQAELVVRNTGYAISLIVAPLVMALLTYIVPGSAGLGPQGTNPQEANTLLVVMITSAALMGMAVSYKAVVGETAILVRERAAGQSLNAYVGSKLVVFSVICALQVSLFLLVFSLRHQLAEHTVGLGSSAVELGIALFATAFASCCLSLLGSALAKSTDQVMQTLIMLMLGQLILCGGLIQISDNAPVNVMSMLVPSRWGFAAAAASIDLANVFPAPLGWPDSMWTPDLTHYFTAIGVLALIGTATVVGLRIKLSGRAFG